MNEKLSQVHLGCSELNENEVFPKGNCDRLLVTVPYPSNVNN